MRDDTPKPTTASRRSVLAAMAAGTVGLAGCLGGGSSDGAADPPVRGDPDAGVTLEAFEDFSCGACRAYTLEGFPLLEESHIQPGAIRYEFRNFPFIGDESFEAANAARAAYERGGGDEAFWPFKTSLFENQSSIRAGSPGLYGDIAAEMGLDRGPIETAAVEESFDDAVSADKSRGEDLGVSSTPSFAIDGDLVDTSDALSLGDVVTIVQQELDDALEEESGGGGY
jgi:protein-disulfide isomerase